METIKQEQAPQLSIVEQKKMEAGKFVASRIEALMEENQEISLLNATRKVYEEVKTHDYRSEQAVAKLLEYLTMQNEVSTMQNEVSMRGEELIKSYDALSSVVARDRSMVSPQQQQSANDDKYLVANVA